MHRGVSPGAIILTAAGSWKLAGLGLASRAQFASSGDSAAVKPFDYRNNSMPAWLQLTQVFDSLLSALADSISCNFASHCYRLQSTPESSSCVRLLGDK